MTAPAPASPAATATTKSNEATEDQAMNDTALSLVRLSLRSGGHRLEALSEGTEEHDCDDHHEEKEEEEEEDADDDDCKARDQLRRRPNQSLSPNSSSSSSLNKDTALRCPVRRSGSDPNRQSKASSRRCNLDDKVEQHHLKQPLQKQQQQPKQQQQQQQENHQTVSFQEEREVQYIESIQSLSEAEKQERWLSTADVKKYKEECRQLLHGMGDKHDLFIYRGLELVDPEAIAKRKVLYRKIKSKIFAKQQELKEAKAAGTTKSKVKTTETESATSNASSDLTEEEEEQQQQQHQAAHNQKVIRKLYKEMVTECKREALENAYMDRQVIKDYASRSVVIDEWLRESKFAQIMIQGEGEGGSGELSLLSETSQSNHHCHHPFHESSSSSRRSSDGTAKASNRKRLFGSIRNVFSLPRSVSMSTSSSSKVTSSGASSSFASTTTRNSLLSMPSLATINQGSVITNASELSRGSMVESVVSEAERVVNEHHLFITEQLIPMATTPTTPKTPSWSSTAKLGIHQLPTMPSIPGKSFPSIMPAKSSRTPIIAKLYPNEGILVHHHHHHNDSSNAGGSGSGLIASSPILDGTPTTSNLRAQTLDALEPAYLQPWMSSDSKRKHKERHWNSTSKDTAPVMCAPTRRTSL